MRSIRSSAAIVFLIIIAGCVDDDPTAPTDGQDAAVSAAIVPGAVELQPLPGEADVEVRAVNSSGQVVGTSGGRVAIWEDAVPTEIPELISVGGINDAGQIVGAIDVGESHHAAVWQDGAVTDLGTLPGETESGGVAITNNGWVAARSSGGRSFLWKDGEITELQPLGTRATVFDVNASGQAVGLSHDEAIDANPIVVWDDGVPRSTGRDLVTMTPVGISDDGMAVSTGDCGCEVDAWQDGASQNFVAPSGERGGGAGGSFWAALVTPGGRIIGGMDGDVYVLEDGAFTMLDRTGSLDNCVAASDSGQLVCIDELYAYPFLTTVAEHTTPAGIVSDLTVESTSTGTATLSWTQVDDGTGSPALYQLRYSSDYYIYYPNGTVGCDPTIEGTAVGEPISCTVQGLEPNTEYEFLLQSFGGTEDSRQWPRYSNIATATTSLAPVTVVQDLSVTASSSSTLSVAWTQVDDGAGSPALYRLKYAAPPIDWPNATVGCERTIEGTQIGEQITCTVEGLQPDTEYDLQLQSFRYDENNRWEAAHASNVATGRTRPTPSAAVGDLTVTSSSAYTMTVEWTQVDDGTGNPASYRVKYAEPSIEWGNATVGCDRTLVGSDVGATMSCTIEGLEVETTYEVQLMSFRSVDGVWEGARYSNVATGSTADAAVIRPVTDLRTSDVGITEMTLTWTQVNDGQGGPASYQLRYAQPPFDWATAEVGCEIVGTQIGEHASCTVDGLRAHWNEYSFQLVSFRDVNGEWADTLYSNVISARTPRVRLAVNDLEVVSTTESTITLRWEQVSDDLGYPARYRVKYGAPIDDWSDATTGCDVVGDGVYVDATCTITGLTPGTTYDLQLMSYRLEDGAWAGARFSNLVTGTTSAGR